MTASKAAARVGRGRSLCAFALVVAIVCVFAAPAVAAGPSATGAATTDAQALGSENASAPTHEVDEAWRFDPGSEVSARPAVTEDAIYVPGQGNTLEAIGTDGTSRGWHVNTSGTPAMPVAGDDRAFVPTSDAALTGIDRANDSETWQYDTGHSSVSSAALGADGDRAFVTSFRSHRYDNYWYVHAVDTDTGERLWRSQTRSDPSTSFRPAVDHDRNVVYAAASDGTIEARDLHDGSLLWDTAIGSANGAPTLVDGTLYLVDRGGYAATVTALDADTGDVTWSSDVDSAARGEVAVVDDSVYVSAGQTLLALDARTGDREWSSDLGARILTTPTVSGETVYVGTNGNEVVGASTADGEPRFRHSTTIGSQSTLVAANGTLYLADDDLHALDGERGAPTARATLSTTVAAVGDRVVFEGRNATAGAAPLAGFEWTVDGEVVGTSDRTDHQFDEPGVYGVTLTVTDDRGATDSTTSQVVVPDPDASNGSAWYGPGFDVANSGHHPNASALTHEVDHAATIDSGDVVGSPALVDGQSYVSTNGGLTAFEDGFQQSWANSFDARTSPTVGDEQVFVGDGAAQLRAFERLGGDRRWRYETRHSSVSSAALGADGDRAFVTSFRSHRYDNYWYVHAVDTDTGERLWRSGTRSDPSTSYRPVVDRERNVVYAAASDGTIQARDVYDGTLLWDATIGSANGAPTLVDGTLYVVDRGGYAATVTALDADTGDVTWSSDVDSAARGEVAVVDDSVYVSAGQTLLALDASTGARQWSSDLETRILTTPTVAGETVYVGTDGNEVIGASTADGEPRFRQRTTVAGGSALLAARGELYLAGQRIDVFEGGTGAPTAAVDAPRTRLSPDESATFAGAPSEPGSAPISTYEWAVDGAVVDNGTELDHAFEAPGVYGVTLTVTDDRGVEDATTVQVLVTDAARRSTEWPGSGYDVQNSGHHPNASAPTHAVEHRATIETGAVAGSPAFLDARTYVSTNGGLTAFADGFEQAWANSFDARTAPTVGAEQVFVGDGAAQLRAFERLGGDRRWRYETRHSSVSSAALGADGDRAFVTSFRSHRYDNYWYVHAVDTDTGERLWRSGTRSDPSASYRPVVDPDRNVVYAAASDGTIQARDVYDGTLLWDATIGSANGAPTLVDGTLYVVDRGGHAATVTALDADTGARIWSSDVDSAARGEVAVADDSVYVSAGQTLLALDARTGDREWSSDLDARILTTPTVAGETVYVGTDGNEVIGASTADGEPRFRQRATVAGGSALVARNGTLTLAGDRLHVFEGGSGAPTAAVDASADVVTPDQPISFDGNDSTAGGAPIASYEWSVDGERRDDGPTFTAPTGRPGVYQVTLTVTDERGVTDAASVRIRVTEDDPGGATEWPAHSFDDANHAVNERAEGPISGVQEPTVVDAAGATDHPPVVVDRQTYVSNEGGVVAFEPGFQQAWANSFDARTAPAVDDHQLLVGDGAAQLRAFERHGGDRRWRYETRHTSVSGAALGADGDRAFVTSFRSHRYDNYWYVHAVDTDTGERLWRSGTRSDPSTSYRPVVDPDRNVVYAAASDGTIRAHDVLDGTLLWDASFGSVDGAPTLSNGTLHVVDGDTVRAIDAETGSEQWANATDGNAVGELALRDGTVYVASDDRVLALDAENGTEHWNRSLSGTVVTPPVGSEASVYVATADNAIHALSEDGAVRWQERAVVDGGTLAVVDGRVYAALGDRLVTVDGDPWPVTSTAGVTVGDDVVRAGETTTLSVEVTADPDVASVATGLTFDPERLSVDGVAAGDLGEPEVEVDDAAGTIALAAANAQGVSEPVLAEIEVTAAPDAHGSVPATLDVVPDATAVTTADRSLPLGALEDGEVGVCRGGDAQNSGEVRSLDATLVQRSVVGLPVETAYYPQCADASGDGTVTSLDATLILQTVVEEAFQAVGTSVQDATTTATDGGAEATADDGTEATTSDAETTDGSTLDPVATTLATTATDVDGEPTLAVGEANASTGAVIDVPVEVRNANEVASYQANVTFDPSVVQVSDVRGADLSAPHTKVDNDEGWIRLVSAQANGVSEPTLATLELELVGPNGTATDLALEETYSSVTNESAPLDVEYADGQAVVGSPAPHFRVEQTGAPDRADPGATVSVVPTVQNVGRETGTAAPTVNGTAIDCTSTSGGLSLAPGEQANATFDCTVDANATGVSLVVATEHHERTASIDVASDDENATDGDENESDGDDGSDGTDDGDGTDDDDGTGDGSDDGDGTDGDDGTDGGDDSDGSDGSDGSDDGSGDGNDDGSNDGDDDADDGDESEPREAYVSIDRVDHPTSIAPGETVDVYVQVQNLGAGDGEAGLSVDAETADCEVANGDLVLDPRQSSALQTTCVADADLASDLTIAVATPEDDRTVRVPLAESDDADGGTGDDGSDDGAGDGNDDGSNGGDDGNDGSTGGSSADARVQVQTVDDRTSGVAANDVAVADGLAVDLPAPSTAADDGIVVESVNLSTTAARPLTAQFAHRQSLPYAPEPETGVGGYVEVPHSPMPDGQVETFELTIGVDADRVDDPERFAALRWSDGSWHDLETRHLGTNASTGRERFVVESPGLATVAVVTDRRTPDDAHIQRVELTNEVDPQGDGRYSKFDLRVEADTAVGPHASAFFHVTLDGEPVTLLPVEDDRNLTRTLGISQAALLAGGAGPRDLRVTLYEGRRYHGANASENWTELDEWTGTVPYGPVAGSVSPAEADWNTIVVSTDRYHVYRNESLNADHWAQCAQGTANVLARYIGERIEEEADEVTAGHLSAGEIAKSTAKDAPQEILENSRRASSNAAARSIGVYQAATSATKLLIDVLVLAAGGSQLSDCHTVGLHQDSPGYNHGEYQQLHGHLAALEENGRALNRTEDPARRQQLLEERLQHIEALYDVLPAYSEGAHASAVEQAVGRSDLNAYQITRTFVEGLRMQLIEDYTATARRSDRQVETRLSDGARMPAHGWTIEHTLGQFLAGDTGAAEQSQIGVDRSLGGGSNDGVAGRLGTYVTRAVTGQEVFPNADRFGESTVFDTMDNPEDYALYRVGFDPSVVQDEEASIALVRPQYGEFRAADFSVRLLSSRPQRVTQPDPSIVLEGVEEPASGNVHRQFAFDPQQQYYYVLVEADNATGYYQLRATAEQSGTTADVVALDGPNVLRPELRLEDGPREQQLRSGETVLASTDQSVSLRWHAWDAYHDPQELQYRYRVVGTSSVSEWSTWSNASQSGHFSEELTLSEGYHTVQVVVRDADGKRAVQTQTVLVDTEAPEIAVDSVGGPDASIVEVFVDERVDYVDLEYRERGGENGSAAESTESDAAGDWKRWTTIENVDRRDAIDFNRNGRYELRGRATDLVGHTSEWNATPFYSRVTVVEAQPDDTDTSTSGDVTGGGSGWCFGCGGGGGGGGGGGSSGGGSSGSISVDSSTTDSEEVIETTVERIDGELIMDVYLATRNFQRIKVSSIEFEETESQSVEVPVPPDLEATTEITLEFRGRGEAQIRGINVTAAGAPLTVTSDGPAVAGEATTLRADVEDDAAAEITALAWDLDGDGETDDSGETVEHTFSEPGTRAVSVTATDVFGDSATETTGVTVRERPTVEIATPNASVRAGESTTLVARPGERQIEQFEWDVDGDGEFERSGRQVTVRPTQVGDRTVTVRATSDAGATAEATATIDVENVQPTAALSAESASPMAGEPILVSARGSNDDGPIERYEWTASANATVEANGSLAWVTAPETGSHEVEVTVTDEHGATDAATATLDVASPLDVSVAAPDDVSVGVPASLNATASGLGADGAEVAWDLDDDGQYDDRAGNQSVRHDFESEGRHEIRVRAAIGNRSATGRTTVTVTNPAGSAAFQAPSTAAVGETVTLSLARSAAPDESYRWTVGNATYRGPNATHAFEDAGAHGATLVVEHDAGATRSFSHTIDVANASDGGDDGANETTDGDEDTDGDGEESDDGGGLFLPPSTSGDSGQSTAGGLEVTVLEAPSAVEPGDDVAFEVQLSNTGEDAETAQLTVERNGERVFDREVQVDGGERTRLEVDLQVPAESGDYQYEVRLDDDAATVDLTARSTDGDEGDGQTDEEPSTEPDGSSDADGDSVPGFGVGVAVLVLLALGRIAGRRSGR